MAVGSKIGEAYVEIKTNQAKFTQELGKLERSVKTSVDKMKRSFDQIGRGVSEISGIARWGFLGMTAAIAGVTYAAQKQEKAVAKLVQQLKNHGEATQENISALTGLASELQKVTQFGDEQIIAGQAMLASFNLTTQQIKELTPHLLNLAIMTENTTGQQADLASVAKMVGVALGGQAGRLVQMGIAITEAQKKTLALADADEKINILMEIFQENAGGLAEATGKTLAGSLSKAKNAMSDLAEELGFLLEPVIVNACAAIVDKMSEWKEAVRSLTPEQKKLITQIVFLGTAALGAIGALGLFAKLAVVVKAAGLIIAGTFGLITSPLGLIMLAVGALALAWAFNWGNIQGKTETVWKALAPIFQGIWGWLQRSWNWTIDLIGKAWDWLQKGFPIITETLNKVWTWTIQTAGEAWKWLKEGVFPTIRETLDKIWTWTIKTAGEAWKWIETEAFPEIKAMLDKIWTWTIKTTGEAWDWLKGEAFPFVFESLSKVWTWTIQTAGEAWKWLREGVIPYVIENLSKIWTWTIKTAGDAWKWLKEGVFPKITESLGKAWTWTLNLSGDAWDWVKKSLFPNIEKYSGQAWEWVLNLKGFWVWMIEKLWPYIEDYAKMAWDWAAPKLTGAWKWIKDTLWPKIEEYTTKAWNWTMVLVGKTWSWIKDELWPALGKIVRVTVEFIQKLVAPEKPEEQAESWVKKFKEYLEKTEKTIELKIKFIWNLAEIVGSFFKGFIKGLIGEFEEDTVTPLEIAKIIGKGLIDGIRDYIEAEFRAWVWIQDIVEEHIEDWKKIGEYIGEKIGEGLGWAFKWWFKGFKVPEEFKLIKKGAEDTGEALKEMIPAGVIAQVKVLDKDLSHLIPIIKGQKVALEYASKGWGTYNQVAKRQIAATAAAFILFEHGITDIAAKAPYEFSEKFEKNFMKAKPKIQKAILDALISGDLERALSLAGVKAGKAFLGQSPGMLTELEEGTKETKKLLDKMLGSMDDMTKKIMKIFQPIVGLFKTIFEAILKIVEKFSPEAAAEIRALVDDVMAMMEGLFNTVEKRQNKWFQGWALLTDKGKSLWQKFCDIIGKVWGSICEAVKASFSDAMVAVIAGTQTIAEAFQALQKSVATQLAKMAVAAIAAGDVITGVLTAATAVLIQFGVRIRETTTHFETAWGTLGRSMAHTTMEMGENILGFTSMLETEFNRVGLAISKTIEDAQYKLEGLYQSQADLGASTREKLIDELDKYYDYRWLKEKSLDELLALSAETRVGIETGAIQEVEEELDQMLYTYNKSVEAYEEAEKKKQEAAKETAKVAEEAAEDMSTSTETAADEMVGAMDEAGEEIEDSMDDAAGSIEDAAEDMVVAIDRATEDLATSINNMAENITRAIGDMADAIVRAINEMVNKINTKLQEIPEEISFDIFGILHMPDIPSIGSQYFDIFGTYHGPSIPSAQIGIPNIPRPMIVKVHKEEAILNPIQAEQWRRGEGGARIEQNIGPINMTAEFPNVDIESLTPDKIERMFQKFIPVIKETARRGIFSRDLVGVRRVR